MLASSLTRVEIDQVLLDSERCQDGFFNRPWATTRESYTAGSRAHRAWTVSLHGPDKLGYRAPDRRPPTWRSHDAQSLAGQGFALLATVTLAPLHASAQGRGSTPARTPDGKPDLAGIYSFSTVTPLQRPDALEGKATLTDEEAAAFEAAENTRLNRDLFDPEKGQPSAGYLPRAQGGVLSYNEFWYERGNKLTRDKRTSLIVDPPDGRIPFTDAARRRVAEMRQRSDSGLGDSYVDRPLADRCLQGFNSGPPMTPGAYNNNVQIVQSPGSS